jgi:predicted GNAT family acetyltransferase
MVYPFLTGVAGKEITKRIATNPNIVGSLLISTVGAQNAEKIMNAYDSNQIIFDDILNILSGTPIQSIVSRIQETPAGDVYAPDADQIEAERIFNEKLNKPADVIPEEKKVTVDDVGFTEAQQDFEPLITPDIPYEKINVQDIGFTAAPDVKPSDYIMTAEEKKTDLKPNEKIFNQISGVKNHTIERDPNDLFFEGWEKMIIAQPKQLGSLGEYAIAIDPMKRSDKNFILVKEGKVHATLELAAPMDQGNVLELDAIGVPVEMQGKGIAKDVLNELFKLADENGVTITGVAQPFGSRTLNKKQLIKFYKSMGFIAKGEELIRKPVIKEETEVSPTAEQSFSDLVDTIEEPTQEISGTGIQFPKEKTDNNIRLHTDRLKKLQDGKINTYPGGPQNERIVLEAPTGTALPDIAIGNITFDDWRERVENNMSKEEVMKAAKWYKKIYSEFDRVGAKDEKERNMLVNAWLSAQINESPTNALSNVLYVYEQYKQGIPFDEVKGKGLPDPTNNIKNIVYGRVSDRGIGAKISDFIDAGTGKNTRSFMGNNEAGGQPFVVDVHTARDTGLVDQTYLNKLKQLGYEIPDDVKIDFGQGGITGTKYENRAMFGNELTEHLNEINWLGKSDWIPSEIQAIGWMDLTEMYGDLGTSGDITMALERNLRRLSMEVAPGEGSPWATQFGESYEALDNVQKEKINNIVTERAIEMVNETFGTDFSGVVHGTGGWELYQNPSTVQQTFASKENAKKAGAMLGYLLNQTEVWVNSSKELTKNPKHYGVDLFEEGTNNLRDSDTLKQFFEFFVDNDVNGIFRGYQPIVDLDGNVGIRIIVDNEAIKNSPLKKADVLPYMQDFIDNQFSTFTKELDFTVQPIITEVELEKLRNDWSKDKNGESFKKYFSEEAGTVTPLKSWSDIGNYLEELTNLFGSQIEEGKGIDKKRKGGYVMPLPKIPSLVNGGLVDINYLTRSLNNGR